MWRLPNSVWPQRPPPPFQSIMILCASGTKWKKKLELKTSTSRHSSLGMSRCKQPTRTAKIPMLEPQGFIGAISLLKAFCPFCGLRHYPLWRRAAKARKLACRNSRASGKGRLHEKQPCDANIGFRKGITESGAMFPQNPVWGEVKCTS